MTDTRLAESFLTNDRLDQLSDGAHRVFVNGLVWSTAQGTDGRLPRRALRYLHPDGVREDLIAELVAAKFWLAEEGGYSVRNYLRYQTPAKQVQRSRDLSRGRKQRERERKRVTRDEARDESSDERRGPLGQDRTGQERTGLTEATTLPDRSEGYTGGPVDFDTGGPA